MATSLVEKLSSYDYTSTTEGGYQWLRKALHPAEETIKSPRCPTKGVRPTATQECVLNFILGPNFPITEGTWSARISIKNDPLCPVEIMSWNDTAPDYTVRQTVLNQCYIDSTTTPYDHHRTSTYRAVLNKFRDACEQYRTTALSLTGYFVGATITDQGSIIAAQCSDAHQDTVINIPQAVESISPMGFTMTQNLLTVDSLMMGTNTYMAPAREGFYMPYKLMDVGRWHSADNVKFCYRMGNATMESKRLTELLAPNCYPYGIGDDGNVIQCPWLPPGDDNLGIIHIRNVAITSSYRLTLRIGIEVMTRPDSSLASFCELPALPDEHALKMYEEIASRMKDAYPSKDNSTGNLWSKIKNIAGGIWDYVSPALAGTPLAPVALAGNAVRAVLPAVEGAVAKAAAKHAADKAAGKVDPEVAKIAAKLNSSAKSMKERASGTRVRSKVLANDPRFQALDARMNEIMSRGGRKGGSSRNGGGQRRPRRK